MLGSYKTVYAFKKFAKVEAFCIFEYLYVCKQWLVGHNFYYLSRSLVRALADWYKQNKFSVMKIENTPTGMS